jgi:hypothetical protein
VAHRGGTVVALEQSGIGVGQASPSNRASRSWGVVNEILRQRLPCYVPLFNSQSLFGNYKSGYLMTRINKDTKTIVVKDVHGAKKKFQ